MSVTDWRKMLLGDVFRMGSGATKPNDTVPHLIAERHVPVFGGNGITGFSSQNHSDGVNIIVGRVGEYCGSVHFYCGPVWITDNALYVREWIASAEPEFFFYLLKWLDLTRLRNKGGQPLISQKPIYGVQVNVPPLAEQKAIAEVLSAWDRAIEQTTALIAAKERLKQGLMQQLFGDAAHSERQLESTVCHLGDVVAEMTRRNCNGLGTVAVYSVTKANGMIPMNVDTIGNDIKRYKLVRPKAFAYNPMRINIGSIARWEGDNEVLVSPDYVVFECGPELDPDYLNHFRRGHVWDSYVKRSGDGSVRVRIYFDHLARMLIRLPGIQEQRRIAKVMNAATSELDLLEKKLELLKKQKRGLMQKLLTGQVRVPISENAKQN